MKGTKKSAALNYWQKKLIRKKRRKLTEYDLKENWKNLYGDQRASLLWENHLSSAATACGWTQLPLGQTLGKAYNGEQPIALPQPFDLDSTVLVLQKVPNAKLRILVFTRYVDDMAMGGKGQDHEWKLLRKYIECDDPVFSPECSAVCLKRCHILTRNMLSSVSCP